LIILSGSTRKDIEEVKTVNALPQDEHILLILLFQASSNDEGKVEASPPNPVPELVSEGTRMGLTKFCMPSGSYG